MADNTNLVIATDDIGGVQHQRVKVQYGTDGSATDVSSANPLPVTTIAFDSPQLTYATAAALAAGGSTDLDSTQITASKTGKLAAVAIGSSVAAKWLLKAVLNGAETNKAAFFTMPGEGRYVAFPSKEFITQVQNAGAGFDGFRITATNLDTSETADVYATFLYDEV